MQSIDELNAKQSLADSSAGSTGSRPTSAKASILPLQSVISLKPEDTLKRVAFSKAALSPEQAPPAVRPQQKDNSQDRDSDISVPVVTENHLIYLGKLILPHHPIRIRYLPYSSQRLLIYGVYGFQEMSPTFGMSSVSTSHEPYNLKVLSWQQRLCDCVQMSDMTLYTLVRSSKADSIVHFDDLMTQLQSLKLGRIGSISSLTANQSGTYLYATHVNRNCVLRISTSELSRKHVERFGTLWRPFDCCISQPIVLASGETTQFLFVSNIDAGIVVFDTATMTVVAECGADFSAGAKYLTYDPNRSILFVSSSYDRQLRCYRFDSRSRIDQQLRPKLFKIDDFMVATKKSSVRSGGPQCIMWDGGMEQLAVLSWSQMRGNFMVKAFRINVDDSMVLRNSFESSK